MFDKVIIKLGGFKMKKNKEKKFLTTIDVLSTKYKIYSFDYACNYTGQSNLKDKIILIRVNLNKEDFASTLLHEFLHCYMFECGFDYYCDETLIFWLEKFIPKIIDNLDNLQIL